MNGFGGDSAAAAAGSGCSTEDQGMLMRQLSRASLFESDDEDSKLAEGYLGPLVPLRDHFERDKEDESLRRWKEQLLGTLTLQSINERVEPEVKLVTLTLIAGGRPDMDLPLPFVPNSRGHIFTLKEGSTYSFKFAFNVHHNLVSGLVYTNTVWKNGIRVDQMRTMLGTFAPQSAPYTHTSEEEITPSGLLARGAYSAKMKFIDDDKRCYLELSYTFEIRKEWD